MNKLHGFGAVTDKVLAALCLGGGASTSTSTSLLPFPSSPLTPVYTYNEHPNSNLTP